MRLLAISILIFFSSAIFAQNFDWAPQNSGVSVKLNDVYFTDNQNGWAVGEDGVIVNTADGGQTWTNQTSGTTENLRAVFFIDANTGWIAGGLDTKTMLKTIDGGSAWKNITPANIKNNQLRDIAFADANTGWVITNDSIFMTNDGGTTWVAESYLSDISQLSHKAIAVTSDSTAYVAGQNKRATSASSYADVFNKRPYEAPVSWGGSVASQFQTDDKLRCIAFSNAVTGFAGGERGIIYKLAQEDPNHLSGPWNKILDLSQEGVQLINSISFPSESNGMFSTSTDVSGTSYTLIYHTADAGSTWSASPDSIQDFLSAVVSAPDTNNAWAVGVGGKIYKGVRSPTGINQMSLNIDVTIYPNPFAEMINVKMNSESNELIRYSLSDMTGRLIEEGQWRLNSPGSRFTLNLSDLIKGVYLLKLSSEEGQSTFRILKN